MSIEKNTLKSESFWKRYVLNPIVGQIKQGVTPEKIAESMAWGSVLGVFPILGATTTLCGIAAIYLKLNHIAIQVLNWLVYPLQILLIIPFLKLGNLLLGQPALNLSLDEIIQSFETDFAGTVQEFGWMGARAIVAWIIFAVPTVMILSHGLRPLARRLAGTIKKKSPDNLPS